MYQLQEIQANKQEYLALEAEAGYNCAICRSDNNLNNFKDRMICSECVLHIVRQQ